MSEKKEEKKEEKVVEKKNEEVKKEVKKEDKKEKKDEKKDEKKEEEEEEDIITKQEREEKEKKKHMIDPISGGYTHKDFVWTQDIFNIQMIIKIPEGTPPKEIKIEFKKKHMKFWLKGKLIIDKEFRKTCNHEESYWQVEDRKELIIAIEKTAGEWWSSVFMGDKEIDVDKIPLPQTSYETLNGEAKSTVEKMMYNQKAKALGLPTVEDKMRDKNIDRLKKMYPKVDWSNMDLSQAKFDFGGSGWNQ